MAPLFALAIACAWLLTISWGGSFPRDGTNLVVGRDFLATWMYGRAATMPDPGQWYDLHIYQRAIAALVGPNYPGQVWSYPPTMMFVGAPFATLPYLAGLVCWTALGLTIFTVVAGRQLADWRLLALVLASPAAVLCLISGQSSFLTASMLITIFALLDRKPVVAGVLIGLLTLKPQLGLLLPVVLVASGRWRTFWVASATTLAIVALTTAIYGTQIWVEYVQRSIPTQTLTMSDPDMLAAPFMPTILMNLRLLGLSYTAASAVQACFSLLAVGVTFWAFRYRKNADPQILFALFCSWSLLGTPYVISYDTLALTFAIVALLASGKLDSTGNLLARLTYWLPLIQLSFGYLHGPGAVLIPLAFAAYLVARLKESEAEMHTFSVPAIAIRAQAWLTQLLSGIAVLGIAVLRWTRPWSGLEWLRSGEKRDAQGLWTGQLDQRPARAVDAGRGR